MGFPFDGEPVLPADAMRVHFDGIFAEPKLAHPEGIAVAPDGAVWCGTETGLLVRVEADGSSIRQMGETGGFILGLCFDAAGAVYACDLKAADVKRLDPNSGAVTTFAKGPKIPNYPVVDAGRGCLYVSDSFDFAKPGPGVWRFDLATGDGGLWHGDDMVFANGMALAPDGRSLYVIETFANRVARIAIGPDGNPAGAEVFVDNLPGLPDGLAFDTAGNLYISLYEPSRVLRADPAGNVRVLVDDPLAHTLCHPTNIAFRGTTLFTSNLGRWHVTAIDNVAEGVPLPITTGR